MMTHYEKPDILRVDNLSEGVYLASGGDNITPSDGTTKKAVCESQYMNGVWHQQMWYISEPTRVIDAYGCRGCAADDGNTCTLARQEAWGGESVFKPIWEQEGRNPDEMVKS